VEPVDGKLVLLISVDGLNPDAITTLGPAGAPAFHRLMAEGVSTLNARTTYESTQTLPNHTSMVTGRWVTQPGGHQVTFNEDNGSTVHVSAGGYVASAFDVAHDAGLPTSLYVGKTKFDFIDRSWNATTGAPDVTGPDNGRDKVDTYVVGAGGTNTPALISRLQAGLTGFTMLHFHEPDGAGHGSGFMSQTYLEAVGRTDARIGQLLTAIAGDTTLAARTTVLVTADHGGLGTSHADASQLVNYRVPFFAWGAGVARGGDFYQLNPDRTDPGTGRPTYTVSGQPVRSAEAGNLVTELLGLPVVPGSGINTNQSLDLTTG
jgi:arylsulfatase A-like enzyme